MDTDTHYPTPEMKELIAAVSALSGEDEIASFLRDLLTIAELQEFANRWKTAKLLTEKMPYAAIAKKLHVSTATVTRVAHWLNHGTGGYRIALSRISKEKSGK